MERSRTLAGILPLSVLALALATGACSRGGALVGTHAEPHPESRSPSEQSRGAEGAPSQGAEGAPSQGAEGELERGAEVTLDAARRSFTTRLRTRGPAPQRYREERPPRGAQEVRYASGDLKLKGWLSKHTPGARRRPAVVFLHGGFAFGAADWADASPFAEAGFVLFMPMLRGENGNPGVYESFYGEVDDAIAAGEYVKSLPHVDGDNIFVAGHSVGGVLAVLTSMMPSAYRAAASLSGYIDMRRFVAGARDGLVPYDLTEREEIRLRNPYDFVSSLRIPLALYADPSNLMAVEPFQREASALGKPCEIIRVPGDHSTMVAPAVAHAIDTFRRTVKKEPATGEAR
ncbi:alpha/beta hydrolase family protein [Sorangium sp. So ce341]|uniref:alpha/beta hydrolase family protein n=1 Tax=Sorangium sp. So ce341 TaxID=3133302 RepID=UPI003F615A77